MAPGRGTAAARRALGPLLVLLAALAVLVHHDLTGSPAARAAGAHAGMAVAADMPRAQATSRVASPHMPGESGGHSGHSCALDGQMCAAQGVGHAFAPVVPAAVPAEPVLPPEPPRFTLAPATGPPSAPPDHTTVLRI
ncbi:hypothetical protein [Streptacidiphilus monticola]|uniref:DUF2946 domain-containing protein n=1 Tax=Streptacidiphilus monticola TaxID=2161674 RepID=A0ABW1G8G9_9ACTN